MTRIDSELARSLDKLIADGAAESRSDAVRQGLEALIALHRRAQNAEAIVRGYTEQPQSERDVGWSDAATIAMIADEPW